MYFLTDSILSKQLIFKYLNYEYIIKQFLILFSCLINITEKNNLTKNKIYSILLSFREIILKSISMNIVMIILKFFMISFIHKILIMLKIMLPYYNLLISLL